MFVRCTLDQSSLGTRLMRYIVPATLIIVVSAFCPSLSAADSDQEGDRAEQISDEPVLPGTVPQQLPPEVQAGLEQSSKDYVIGRQDLLEIRVFDLEELSQTVRVSSDGSISLPLLGRLPVAGTTLGDVETLIARRLEAHIRSPQVTVFVKEYESTKVSVSGAVKNPNSYEMLGPKTLLEMISMAGGLDEDHGDEIVIFRGNEDGGTERVSIDLRGLVYDVDPDLNILLEPGDIIYIPGVETMRISVGGSVRLPNLYEVPRNDPISLLEAITLAGGTTDRAAEKKVKIIRTAKGTRVTLLVNLRKVKKGKVEDPLLKDGDLILVPRRFF